MSAARDEAAGTERVWPARLRWRLRGAWQWPTFCLMTVVDALLLARLPFAGGRSDVPGALLTAGFANLVVVAAIAPALGLLVRRRRPELPRAVAGDYAGTAGLLVLGALILAGGIAHHGSVERSADHRAAALDAARRWFAHNAPAGYRRNIGGESVWHPGTDLYRICVAGPQDGRDLCVYVDTSDAVVTVRRDADGQPNAVIAGPENPGRVAR